MWQWIKPRAIKLLKFLWDKRRYIIWLLVYGFATMGYLGSPIHVFLYETGVPYQHIPFLTFVIFSALYALTITIAIYFGDIILRVIEGVRPIETEEEKEYLIPLFEELCQEVKEIFPSMPKTKLYIIDNQTVNAHAMGRNTIAVTQGAIRTFSREELKAFIAHEMGHIYHGDTKAVLLNTIGNGIFSLAFLIIKIILKILDIIQAPFERKTSGLISAFLDLLGWLLYLVQVSFLFVGNIILMGNSRKTEYMADKFAYLVGYGREMKDSLYIIQKMTLSDQLPIVERIQASHPRVSRRIMKVEQLLAKE